ncbi:hypothetical protein HYV89_00115 [Candidatus Woesearchaeota archaeon]|nr:hypothetical protein [Candidatus Woesearchaeota archaeon]
METEMQKKELDEIITTTKTIVITTSSFTEKTWNHRFFPPGLNYRSHLSRIEFSNPFTNHKGEITDKLHLCTTWRMEAFGANPYWMQMLDDEIGYNLLCSDIFAQLKGDFSRYSESRLKSWQEEGYKRHKKVLNIIEELYTFNESEVLIPKDLFSL